MEEMKGEEFRIQYERSFLPIDINFECNFTKLQKLVCLDSIISLLPLEYVASTNGTNFIECIIEYLVLNVTIDNLSSQLKFELRNAKTSPRLTEKKTLSLNDLNFIKNENKNQSADLFENILASIFIKPEEVYSFYKLLLFATLYEKSLSIDKVEYLLKIRHHLALDNRYCAKILHLMGQKSGNPSYAAVKGIDHVNFVFATVMKSILIDHTTIGRDETQFITELWQLLSSEGDRKNYLIRYLDKSELPENRKFHITISKNSASSILCYYSILLSKAQISEKSFNEIEAELLSYGLNLSEFSKSISNSKDHSPQQLAQSFSKIDFKDKFFIFLEGLQLLIKAGSISDIYGENLLSVAGQISPSDIVDSESSYLMLCEFVLLHRSQIKTFHRIIPYLANLILSQEPELQSFHLFSIVFNLLRLRSESLEIKLSDLGHIFELLLIDQSSLSVKWDLMKSEEIQRSVLRLLLLSEIHFLMEGKVPDVDLFTKLADRLFVNSFSSDLNEYIVRVIATSFISGGKSSFKIQQDENSDRIYKVVVMNKGHRNFFNTIIDRLHVEDDVIRRILYLVAIETGVLMLFNERIDYSKFKIKK